MSEKKKIKDKLKFPEIEEMKCPTCSAVTGHKIKKGNWVCVHCDTPLKNK